MQLFGHSSYYWGSLSLDLGHIIRSPRPRTVVWSMSYVSVVKSLSICALF